MCVAARIDTSVANFYYAGNVGGGFFDVGKCVNGTFTQLAQGSTTITSGVTHPLRLAVHGSFLVVHGSGLGFGSVVDSDITAAGRAGVHASDFQGSTSGVHMESWQATAPTVLDARSFTNNNAAANATVTGLLPSGTADGDLLIAEVGTLSSTATVSAVPSGWSFAGQVALSAGNGFIRTYYKIANSEPASWNWTLSAAVDWTATVYAHVGPASVILDTVAYKSQGWGTNANFTQVAYTAPRNNALVHATWADSVVPAVYPTAGVSPSDLLINRNAPPTPWTWIGWYRQEINEGSIAAYMSRGGAASNAAGQLVVFVPTSETDGAPVFINQTESNASSRTLTVNVPAGTVDGDVMIAAMIVDRQTVTITDPAGWTRFASDNKNSGLQYFYYKVAASEPASYTWNSDPISSFMALNIRTYRGVDINNPIDAAIAYNTGASSVVTSASITTTVDNDRVLMFATQGGTRTIDASSLGNVFTSGSSLHGADGVKGIAGAVGENTMTLNSSATWFAWTFSIKIPPTTVAVRPISDTSLGNWTNELGTTANLYASIDEATASDTDYVQSSRTPSNDTVRFKLANVADPLVSSGYQMKYRIQRTGSVQTDLAVRLIQGASTEIARWDHANVSTTYADVIQTLTSTQADAITNHNDLYLEFIANVPSVSGPGGIATTNVKLWLKADALSLTDGTAVSSWTDSGPLGLHAVQSTSNLKPVFKTSILNGKPSIRFDTANDQRMQTPAMDLTDTAKVSVFMVATLGASGYRLMYESTNGDAESTQGTIQGYRRPTTDLRVLHRGDATPSPQFVMTDTTYATTPYYVTVIHDVTQAAGNEIVLYRNGVDRTTSGSKVNTSTNNTNTAFGNHVLTIANRGSGGFGTADLDFFELIVLKGDDATERSTIHSYLSTKYGI